MFSRLSGKCQQKKLQRNKQWYRAHDLQLQFIVVHHFRSCNVTPFVHHLGSRFFLLSSLHLFTSIRSLFQITLFHSCRFVSFTAFLHHLGSRSRSFRFVSLLSFVHHLGSRFSFLPLCLVKVTCSLFRISSFSPFWQLIYYCLSFIVLDHILLLSPFWLFTVFGHC